MGHLRLKFETNISLVFSGLEVASKCQQYSSVFECLFLSVLSDCLETVYCLSASLFDCVVPLGYCKVPTK